MLLIRDPRFASALVIVGVSAFAISRGVDLTGFAVAEMSAEKRRSRRASRHGRTHAASQSWRADIFWPKRATTS